MKGVKIFSVIIFISVSQTYAQERFNQITAGIALGSYISLSGNFGFETKFKSINSTTFSLEYNFYKVIGSAAYKSANTTFSNPVESNINYVSLMANWYPFDNEKRPYSLLHLAAGITYYRFSYFDNLYSSGPGVRVVLGYKFLIKKRFHVGVNTDLVLIRELTNTDYPYTLDGLYLNINLGYRLF